jgi:hypothetical protein
VTAVVSVLEPRFAHGHPFYGLSVADTAGLRLRPGALRPVFDQDVWDLTGLADAPAVMSAHRRVLDFTPITNPRWRRVAREYLLARLVPGHPAVATLPNAFRAPLNPNTLWNELKHLTSWFNHLTTAGVSSLSNVDQRHCDAFLDHARRSTTDPSRPLSAATTVTMLRPLKHLALYAEILSDTYRPGFVPWADRGADEVAGYTRTTDNRVPPVPDMVIRPLLADSLYLLQTVGPHLLAETATARAADTREMECRRGLPAAEIDVLRDAIDQRRLAGVPACPWPGIRSSSRSPVPWATAGTWKSCALNCNDGSPSAVFNNPGAGTRPWSTPTAAVSRFPGRHP